METQEIINMIRYGLENTYMTMPLVTKTMSCEKDKIRLEHIFQSQQEVFEITVTRVRSKGV